MNSCPQRKNLPAPSRAPVVKEMYAVSKPNILPGFHQILAWFPCTVLFGLCVIALHKLAFFFF